MTNIHQIYSDRASRFEQLFHSLKQKYNYYSIIRLVVFFIGLFVFIFLISQFGAFIGIFFLLVFLTVFVRFVIWHRDILRKSEHNRFLSVINQEEIDVLENHFHHFDPGDQYLDAHHPYSLDLDVFGEYSVFQCCNRTSSVIGSRQLAQYFSKPASQKEIESRQSAVRELSNLLDWRQNFQAFGRVTKDDPKHLQLLHLWLADDPFIINNKWLRWSLYFIPLWMFIGMGISLYYLSWKLAVLFILLPAFILYKTVKQVNHTHVRTTHAEKILSYYSRLIRHIESQQFQSKKLVFLQQKFTGNKQPASIKIQAISRIISQLNVRYNIFAVLLNLGGLWDLQWVYRLEKWKKENKATLPQWFEALQHFEALISLATLSYNNPDWTFPVIIQQEMISGQEMGHPLIHHSKRINNDFQTPTQGHIKLVTGSNMAGKSTFLRTVGINIVLSMAGAPVCAKKLHLPLLEVYSSMRTKDALHENTSSFYAELKRLKVIIEAVEDKSNVYFLLDEILKGTNSKDRHTGSKGLIEQLIRSKGAGIIATHDLELGSMEAQSDGAIENLCMDVEVKEGKLFFDYKIKKGISKSFNATILMKEMGIKI